MYTIFIDDIPIYLTEKSEISNVNSSFHKDEITIEKLLRKVKQKAFDSVNLYHSDLEELWKEFQWFFRIEEAAGGVVKNDQGDILFIYRNDKWDLPKGKIEEGEQRKEAAIREVEEECGISGLEITGKLQTTYHIFQRKERETLKVTYWYEMKSSYQGELKPQLEEGITEVVFKDTNQTIEAYGNTYENIKLLLDEQ